jgi:hypothetical protein
MKIWFNILNGGQLSAVSDQQSAFSHTFGVPVGHQHSAKSKTQRNGETEERKQILEISLFLSCSALNLLFLAER